MINPKWEMLLRDWDTANDKALAWIIKSWSQKDEDKEISLLYYKKFKKEVRAITLKMKEITDNNKLLI